MQLTKKLLLIASLCALTSCSHLYNNRVIANRDNTYLKSQSIRPIQIPPGLSSDTIEAEYPVSDRVYPESSKKVSLIPPELYPGK